jgi:hypothetical protein
MVDLQRAQLPVQQNGDYIKANRYVFKLFSLNILNGQTPYLLLLPQIDRLEAKTVSPSAGSSNFHDD